MKLTHTFALLATLAGAGLWLLHAADSPATPTTAYNTQRSFAQPVRENPVGKKLPATRSFLGAPPPMPHTFSGDRDGRYCLECHAQENHIGKRQQAIAPVPHTEFSQCQQCHVNGSDRTATFFRENNFVGLDDPGKGTRAFVGAPPTIPHKTFMRENCLACHGPAGKQRIATPHPFRSQCQQCHVSDAMKNYNRPVPWAELDGEF